MSASRPRYSKEEFARRGDAIYEGDIRPHVEQGNEGKFVAIDIETGAYEVDADELAASDHLLARFPDAQVWLKRIGSRYVRRFGIHPHKRQKRQNCFDLCPKGYVTILGVRELAPALETTRAGR